MREPVTELTLEAPAGLIAYRRSARDGKVTGVTFTNVPRSPSISMRRSRCRDLGHVSVDVAYGGMFYVIADADAAGPAADSPMKGRDICPPRRDDQGRRPASSCPSSTPSSRLSPASPSPSSRDRRRGPDADRKNAVRSRPAARLGPPVDVDRASIDRSPCGTGTCAKMATLHARGTLPARSGLRPRGHPGDGLHRPAGRGDEGRTVPRRHPRAHRSGAGSPGYSSWVVDPIGSVPGRLHPWRHLVTPCEASRPTRMLRHRRALR